jgi:hypothetical protein
MQRNDISRLLATDGDRLLAIVSMKELLRFLRLKIDLEGVRDKGPDSTTPVPKPREKQLAHH